MAYTEINFQSKKALKEAVKSGLRLQVYQPNNIFGVEFKPGDVICIEGPHYPKPHKFWAECRLGADGCIDKVK